MSDNVYELFKKPLSVENLEKITEMVRRGELTAIGIIGVTPDNLVFNGYSVGGNIHQCFTLIGGLNSLATHINHENILVPALFKKMEDAKK